MECLEKNSYELTLPNAFNDEVCGKGPLNTSHIKQPTPHMSDDLQYKHIIS